MGRTQPSYTSAIDREMEKFERILRRASPNLLPVLERAKEKIRYFQNASYDEEISPTEIVFLSLLSELEEECKND